ncbi:ewing's tumor-associated antigen 1 [Betta splendens]|uniref:Ewing's tumor-associated antigen 1 n=1 Tax=Betta splendens TaxID=158456 RepID=A0A6P7PYG3_BETSP|nr:ewing's tumor-associated antigen 1 [Betta splendens]
MSGTGAHAAASSEFTELWRTASIACRGKPQDNKPGQQVPDAAAPSVCNDLHSPNRTGRYLNNGESPCDVEASQDIFWDSTSPTQANAGSGFRNNRVVEISDIVNRIAPKDVKANATDSFLLQWIGDSAVPSTPEIAKPRLRKRSCRQNSVEDLMKLARQFDENMQQDKESSEQLISINNNLNECVNTSQTKLTKAPSSSDPVETELHALFDCSTQKVSGQFSQGSSVPASSQEMKDLPGKLHLTGPQQSELKPTDKSSSAAHPAEQKGCQGFSASHCDDFDDDWENDDLLNDSFILAMTQNPDQQPDTYPENTLEAKSKTNTTQVTPVYSTGSTNATHQPSSLHSKPNCSALQELCPKPKTTNRSTFKLEPNPYFQSIAAAKDVSKPNFTVVQTKTQMSDRKTARPKTLATPQPDNITNHQKEACVAAGSSIDISDSLWDDGEDDALLYQVCDTVERISNSQPQHMSSSNCQERQDINLNGQQKASVPLAIGTVWTVKPGARRSLQDCVQPNSLPSTNIPIKGASIKSWMSHSLPGSRESLGSFGQCKESSGTFHDNSGNMDTKPRTVKSHHTAFKRHVSDSAIDNKAFITTGKCSAAEIERKKQEALARKRLRMQNASKP